jgi:hypothetical protein
MGRSKEITVELRKGKNEESRGRNSTWKVDYQRYEKIKPSSKRKKKNMIRQSPKNQDRIKGARNSPPIRK